jgi:ATP-dependent DNA helicase RecG
MKTIDIFEIQSLREDYDIEFKTAAGQSGKGELPKSFWETYAAMANTYGGYIYLGVKENKKKEPVCIGICNPEQVKKELCDALNNTQKVSSNILTEDDIVIGTEKQSKYVIIRVHVPQADRKQRPVYINGNPLTGTYRRNYEGDYHCDKSTVKQMLSDQLDESQDSTFLTNFKMDDIDSESLRAYRQNFSNRQPTHPFNNYDDIEFLRHIGGWIQNRNTEEQGLSLAGLLMFGKLRSILDAVPNYIVDYQERPRATTETRWIDRVTTDFSWSGNLFDFYRRVISKLCSDLKVPFVLEGNTRIDDTIVHQALREALVNTIIHADYSGRISILVVKRPDLFGFRNPGTLRVPISEAIRGGVSDCRNRNLQKMFQLIGYGDQAGSGFPKIFAGWESQHWRKPEIEERLESNQTVLTLSTISLLPDNEIADLQETLNKKVYDSLTKLDVIALITAKIEGSINHRRLKELTNEHSADLTKTLHVLVAKNLLMSEGAGQATFYYRPGQHPIKTDFSNVVTSKANVVSSGSNVVISRANVVTSLDNVANTVSKSGSSEPKSGSSEAQSGSSDSESSSSTSKSGSSEQELIELANAVALKGKVSKGLLSETIVEMCQVRELGVKELAKLLNRQDATIQAYVKVLCDNGTLIRKYRNLITHPKQKYKAK